MADDLKTTYALNSLNTYSIQTACQPALTTASMTLTRHSSLQAFPPAFCFSARTHTHTHARTSDCWKCGIILSCHFSTTALRGDLFSLFYRGVVGYIWFSQWRPRWLCRIKIIFFLCGEWGEAQCGFSWFMYVGNVALHHSNSLSAKSNS